MTRFAAILLMLKFAAPDWGPKVETAYLLEKLEREQRISAELVIADVDLESGWRERVINQDSGTVGLMQIQPEDDLECRGHHPEVDGCLFVREGLLDWRTNLVKGVAIFVYARDFCKNRGHEAVADWLNIPTGWDAVRGSHCGYSKTGMHWSMPRHIVRLIQRASQIRAASLRHADRQR